MGKAIVDSAYRVHGELGPGLLERGYESCFEHERTKRGLRIERQVAVPVYYDGVAVSDALRLDARVESLVICEIKAQENEAAVWDAPLLSYVRLAKDRLGYRIYFRVTNIGNAIRRMILKWSYCVFPVLWQVEGASNHAYR